MSLDQKNDELIAHCELICQIMSIVVRELTGCGDDLDLTYVNGEHSTIFRINVSPAYKGRLVGTQGRTISALRNLLAAMAGRRGYRAVIDLVE